MNKILSIIIPIYNAEAYLHKNLLTIVNQKDVFDEYEIILVNDGSTDLTEKICLEFKEKYKNIKYIFQLNKGVSEARNIGIENAGGKYICFLDSDDYVSEYYVKTIIEKIGKFDFIIFNNFTIEGNKKRLEKEWLNDRINTTINKNELIKLICENNLNAPWDKVFLKDLIVNNKIKFKSGLNLGEDLLFNLDYANLIKEAYISNESIYYHTINNNSLSNKKCTLNKMKDYKIIYEEVMNRIECFDEKEESIKCLKLSFIRILANYAGKLHKNGFSKKEIKMTFLNSKIYDEIIDVDVYNWKDYIRKIFLKHSLYSICAKIFNK